MKFTIVNQDEIPPNLPPGTYKTRVVSTTFEEIRVEFINEEVKDHTDCLIKLVKSEDDYVDPETGNIL